MKTVAPSAVANQADRRSAAEPQATRYVLMIRPAHFAGNPATAASNAFQARATDSPAGVHAGALMEFEALAQALSQAGVEIFVFDDTLEPHKPDAIFPDNWVSFHADGTAVLFPMMAENRRCERRLELLERLTAMHEFYISRAVDLTAHERNGEFLEGAGSLVLDRVNRLAYACLSPRTHLGPLGDFAQRLDYQIVSFEACDANGVPVYHTNVLMSVGPRFAVVCSESIRDVERRDAVRRILTDTGHELIELSFAQMGNFAGNMLALETQAGAGLIAMSSSAWTSLERGQRSSLERHGTIVTAPIPTIEHYGGGSVRCMLADIHLPRRKLD
jgi:hypothetical protein